MNYQALLFCPDEKTARVVTQVLTELEFSVELCNEPFATVKKLMAKQYEALVVDCDNEQNAALLFKSARNSTSNQASLAVAVVEGQAGVAKAFRIGANLVLTKPVNVEQSKGTLRVARGLLRKAETTKATSGMPLAPAPSGVSWPVSPNLNSPAAPAQAHKPTSPASFRASSSSIPAIPAAVASRARFDIEEDPTPQLEATEAAFLQSIPEPGSVKTAETHQSHKDSPWLQLSRPGGQSKTPVAGSSSETSLKEHPAAEVNTAVPAARVRHPFNTGLSAGQAAAAAPAKDKMSSPSVKDPRSPSERAAATPSDSPRKTELKPAAASSIELPQEEASRATPNFVAATGETNRSRAPLIAALVVIALAWAGYFGWNKMQSAAKPPVIQNNAQSAPGVPQIQASTSTPTDPSQSETHGTSLQSPLSPPQQLPQLNQDQQAGSRPIAPTPGGKPSPDEIVVVENSVPDTAVESKVLTVKKTREPIAVKNNAVEVEQTIAPPALQAQANSSDQTIAGLITSTSVPVPKRAPELLRVSQGISEGMLVKRVKPIYPAQAVQMHKEGTVQILASIGKNGSISNAKLIQGDPMLAQAALTAVKQWKYQPYALNGQPVEVQTQISVNFKLP